MYVSFCLSFCRGYYIRAKAIDHVLTTFLTHNNTQANRMQVNHLVYDGVIIVIIIIIYRLDAETKGSTRFRIPTALSCSVPSAARTLLRAGGILNRVDPIGRGV